MAKKPKPTKTAGRTRKAPKTAAPRGTRDPRLPAPGTVLQRTFKGKELRVTVLDEGFRWDGRDFRSLTAVALAITGYPACSGPHFFGLDAATAAAATSSRTTTPRGSRKGTKDAAPTATPTAPITPTETPTA